MRHFATKKRDMRTDVRRFVRRTCGKCTGALRARFANIATSLHKFKQFKFEKNNLIFLDANFARAQREPRARTLRKQTHHRLNQDLRLLRAVSATMAADFLVRCGAKNAEKLQTFREFLRGEIARSRRRTRHFASPKAASTQANAAVI